MLLARNQGMPLVSVAAIVQQPLTSIISVGSKHITHVSQLRGKRVGDAGIPYQHAYLKTILAHAGVPASSVNEVNVGANLVPAMLSGKVDATLGAFWNYEAIQLRQMGKHPNVIRVDRAASRATTSSCSSSRPSSPSTPTWSGSSPRRSAADISPSAAIRSAAVANLVKTNPGLDPKLQLASVRPRCPHSSRVEHATRGASRPRQWNAYGQWMLNHHLISNPNAVAAA